jgi:hypothetical protein
LGTTPGHEVWTQEAGWTFAGDVRVGDTFVDREGGPAAIVGIWLDPRPTPVYNLEIDGTFTYFVDGLWVHNNSCDLAARAIGSNLHHALAKFLGGAANGLLVELPKRLHDQFHSMLYEELRNFGVKRGSGS